MDSKSMDSYAADGAKAQRQEGAAGSQDVWSRFLLGVNSVHLQRDRHPHTESDIDPGTDTHGAGQEPEPATRILVCEDNAMNQKVIRLMLEHLGFSSDFVKNGVEALE